MSRILSYKSFDSLYQRYRFNPVKVTDNLYRGKSVLSPINMKKLKKDGITQIIDLRNSAGLKKYFEKMLCYMFGIKYINCKFPHRLNNLPKDVFFKEINNAILSNQGNSYLHCYYGIHRTGLAVAIHEKLHTHKSDDEIINNMINNGYKEILSEGITKKEKKYLNLYQEMISKYFY